MSNLAKELRDLRSLDESEALFREMLQLSEQVYGVHHLEYARALEGFVILLTRAGRVVEAEPLARHVLSIRSALLPAGDIGICRLQVYLARLLLRLDQREEARLLLEAAASGFDAHGPTAAGELAATFSTLVKLHESSGDVAAAAHFQEKERCADELHAATVK